ncbi:MAG: polysaccharide biosynthesis/export family protein [Candidatus Omnitrophota bacterium]
MAILGTVGLISMKAFCQGKEFQRQRFGSWESPFPGEETPEAYRICMGDTLSFSVWRNPDLSVKQVVVNPDGVINYPLIGSIKVSGLTMDELQGIIEEKLAVYVRYPSVTVDLVSLAGKKFAAFGEIQYPGAYTFQGSITVLDAIALAGGISPGGKRESVIVVSNNFTDAPVARRLNIFRALRTGIKDDPAYYINDGDVIYVPQQFWTSSISAISQLSSLFGGFDTVTADMFQWRKELRWFYKTQIYPLRDKILKKDSAE